MALKTDWIDGEVLYADDLNDNFNFIEKVFDSLEQLSVSVTTSNASESYSTSMDHHIIKNIGLTPCYVDFDTAATTDSFELKPFEYIIIDESVTSINAITSSGTTTLRVIGQK